MTQDEQNLLYALTQLGLKQKEKSIKKKMENHIWLNKVKLNKMKMSVPQSH